MLSTIYIFLFSFSFSSAVILSSLWFPSSSSALQHPHRQPAAPTPRPQSRTGMSTCQSIATTHLFHKLSLKELKFFMLQRNIHTRNPPKFQMPLVMILNMFCVDCLSFLVWSVWSSASVFVPLWAAVSPHTP